MARLVAWQMVNKEIPGSSLKGSVNSFCNLITPERFEWLTWNLVHGTIMSWLRLNSKMGLIGGSWRGAPGAGVIGLTQTPIHKWGIKLLVLMRASQMHRSFWPVTFGDHRVKGQTWNLKNLYKWGVKMLGQVNGLRRWVLIWPLTSDSSARQDIVTAHLGGLLIT